MNFFYRLYEPSLTGGPRIVRFVSLGEGEKMVREKRAEQGVDRDGRTPCFCLVKEQRVEFVAPVGVRSAAVREGLIGLAPSESVFTRPEIDAIAGTNFKDGKSRTARMNELQREQRQRRIFAASVERHGYGVEVRAEDFVERATNKQKAWAQLKGYLDRVRVREIGETSDVVFS